MQETTYFFSDEKTFVLQQNDRVWSESLRDVTREKSTILQYQNAWEVMVWGFYLQRSKNQWRILQNGCFREAFNASYHCTDIVRRGVILVPARWSFIIRRKQRSTVRGCDENLSDDPLFGAIQFTLDEVQECSAGT
jgi:hypothetical protein